MKLIILDRDGVINQDSDNFIKTPEEWIPIPYSLEAIASLKHSGWTVAIATNQSGISRGFYTWKEFDEVNNRMLYMIGDKSPIIAIFANGHLTNLNNNWRKPNPGMILKAANKFKINLKDSILIGDRLTDLKAGLNAGIGNLVHLLTGHGLDEREDVYEFINKKSKRM